MLEIDIKDTNNNTKDKLALNESIFNCSADPSVVHFAVCGYLANMRQGTHATKTRAMVSGGGKKPWKQKHTGRARHGSTRSPIWRGGGTVFGPQPRDYRIKLSKAVKQIALHKALSMKLQDGEIIVLDNLHVTKPHTKTFVSILDKLKLADKTSLFVLAEPNDNIYLSIRNIPTADCLLVDDLNAYHLASYDYVIFTLAAINKLQAEAS